MGVLTCDYVAALIRKWSKATQHNAWCPIYGHSEKEGFAFNAKYGSSHSETLFCFIQIHSERAQCSSSFTLSNVKQTPFGIEPETNCTSKMKTVLKNKSGSKRTSAGSHTTQTIRSNTLLLQNVNISAQKKRKFEGIISRKGGHWLIRISLTALQTREQMQGRALIIIRSVFSWLTF